MRGRPVIEGSKRQLKLKARADKIASGILIKPGRPVKIKENKVSDNTNILVTQ